MDMKYDIITLNERRIIGFTARTNNNSPDMSTVIGGVWQKFFTLGYNAIPDKVNGKTLGIYTDYDSDENGDYTFMAACEANGNAPDGFEVRMIPAGRYAKFVVCGNMFSAVAEFWQMLWNMKLDRTYICDFEEYQNADPENCEIHIYIGIR